MMDLNRYKKLITVVILIFSIFLSIFGGVRVMSFFLSIIIFFLLGMKVNELLSLYRDYKLAMKMNSLSISQKQFKQMEEENKSLKDQLESMNQRLQFYSANNKKAGAFYDDISRYGSSRVRENIETD